MVNLISPRGFGSSLSEVEWVLGTGLDDEILYDIIHDMHSILSLSFDHAFNR
jgi:hypothetical protein